MAKGLFGCCAGGIEWLFDCEKLAQADPSIGNVAKLLLGIPFDDCIILLFTGAIGELNKEFNALALE